MAKKASFPYIPFTFMVIMMATLLYLGFWQVQRLGEKETLLAHIDNQLTSEPVALSILLPDANDWEYRRVTVSGTFDHARELFVFVSGPDGGAGYHVYTPLIRINSAPLIVNRGWVPADKKDPVTRVEGQITGLQTFDGIVRLDREAAAFQPPNDAAGNIWFTPVVSEMAAAMNLSTVAPVFVDAVEQDIQGGWPQGGVTRVNIPNNHFSYALTWFGLAFSLLVVSIIWWRRRDN